ncbi:hypothetical protein GGF50DRAFT_89860 [Schizophyllum commune]
MESASPRRRLRPSPSRCTPWSARTVASPRFARSPPRIQRCSQPSFVSAVIITGKALSDANDVQLQRYALGTRLPTETSKPAHALVLTYTDLARTKNGLFQETTCSRRGSAGRGRYATMGASGEEAPGMNNEEAPGALGKESSGWTTSRVYPMQLRESDLGGVLDMLATTAPCDQRARTILDFGTALQNFIAFSMLNRLVVTPGIGALDRVVLGVERNLLDSVGDATAVERSATIVDNGDLAHSERLPRPARPFGLNESTASSASVASVVAQSKLTTAPVMGGGEGVPATEDGGVAPPSVFACEVKGAAARLDAEGWKLRASEELEAGLKRSKGLEATQTPR